MASPLIGKKATEDAQQTLGLAATAMDAPLLAIKKRMLEVGERDTIQSYFKRVTDPIRRLSHKCANRNG